MISISKGSEICSEAVARKQESTRPCGLWPGPWAVRLLGCPDAMEALCPGLRVGTLLQLHIPFLAATGWRAPHCHQSGSESLEVMKRPGHSRDTVTCLIPLFYFRDERRSCESLLRAGSNIQFVLSMVYCCSFIQISPPAGFVCSVDEFEFDTAKLEPEIISYVTIHGSNQMHATSLHTGLELRLCGYWVVRMPCHSWSSSQNPALVI